MNEKLTQEFIDPSNQRRINTCPYCKGKIPSKNKEHLFNASWGGKASSNKLICDSCNARFARTIDLAFTPLVDRVLNMWGMAPNRSKKIPHIHINGDLAIGPYNILHKKGVTFEHSEKGDKFNFNLSANSKSEIKRFIDNGELETVIGKELTDKQKVEIKSKLTYKQETGSKYSQPMMNMSIDLKDQYRSAMHTAIKIILLYKPSTLNLFDLKQVIDFVYSGSGNFQDFAILTKEFMSFPVETPIVNVVSIYFSKEYKKIIGCFNLLNRIKLSFIMADYDKNQDVTMLASEGFNGAPNLSVFQTTVPRHLPALPFVEIISDSLSNADIENQIKELLLQVQYTDRYEVYKNLTKDFRNEK